jgi:hypothetical protein
VARREVLNNPVRLGERAPNILICAAAMPPKLARAAAPNGGYARCLAEDPLRSVTSPRANPTAASGCHPAWWQPGGDGKAGARLARGPVSPAARSCGNPDESGDPPIASKGCQLPSRDRFVVADASAQPSRLAVGLPISGRPTMTGAVAVGPLPSRACLDGLVWRRDRWIQPFADRDHCTIAWLCFSVCALSASALIRAAMAGWRRSLSRQRPRLGPMLRAGMPSLALISA